MLATSFCDPTVIKTHLFVFLLQRNGLSGRPMIDKLQCHRRTTHDFLHFFKHFFSVISHPTLFTGHSRHDTGCTIWNIAMTASVNSRQTESGWQQCETEINSNISSVDVDDCATSVTTSFHVQERKRSNQLEISQRSINRYQGTTSREWHVSSVAIMLLTCRT